MQHTHSLRPAHRARRREGGRGGPSGSPGVLLRAIRYLGHYRRVAIMAYSFLFVATAAQLTVPQFIQRIIDAITNGFVAQQIAQVPTALQGLVLKQLGWTVEQLACYQNNAESILISTGLLIAAFAVARGFFAFAQTYTAERVSQSVAFDFRNELFAKIQRLSFSYHDRNQTGQLMIRATDDVEKVRMFIAQGLLMAVQALVVLIAALIILFATNAELMLTLLPVLPLAMILFLTFGRLVQPMFMKVQQKLSRLNTILQENLAGIKVVRAFVREPQEQAKFDASAEDLMQQHIRVARIFSFLFPVVFLLMNVGQVIILYFGGKQIIYGDMTFGEWQKFSLYLMFVFFPLGMLGMIINQMAQAGASAQRVFEILDAQSDVENRPNAVNLPPVAGNVAFEGVTFRYFGSGEPVLQEVSFEAKPGQTIALLGATGSGKSTIINLIPRFYDVTSGAVKIDGHDVRDVCLDSLRAQIGIVLQDTTLFSGTVRDNIAFGRPEAGMDEVIAAAKAAAAHDFIVGFPDGYDTVIGERGTTLSGGQKQRVAIARALLMDPRILILDDSTSSVDLATEVQIQRALTQLMQGRTSFVIAQRISTVRNADLILVLDKGQIAARGKHQELMEHSAIYAEIYSSQLVEDAVLA